MIHRRLCRSAGAVLSLPSFLCVGLGLLGWVFSSSVLAAGVATLNGTTTNSCAFSILTGDASGNFTATCRTDPASTNATFAVLVGSPAAATGSVPQGGSLPVSVTRSGSGLGSDNGVALSLPAGATLASGAASTVSFTSTDAAGTPKSFGNVTFATSGTATLGLTGTPGSNNITSATVTVTPTTPSGCTNTGAVTQLNGLLLSSLGSTVKVITGPNAFHFKMAAGEATGFAINYEYASSGTLNPMDTTVSTCAGDFTASGLSNPADCVTKSSTSGLGVSTIATRTGWCILQPDTDYYLNIKPSVGQSSSAFIISIIRY